MVEELGIASRLHETDVFAARIDLLEGDAAAAERSLRTAYEGLRELGLGIDAARAAALLARALLAQGRAAEAEAVTRESEALAGDDLQAAIAWRGVRAEALAQRGEHATAIELARTAVTMASETDALLVHADARVALAAVLRAAGRHNEAEAEERRARELWEAKGATRLVERARVEPSATPREVKSAPLVRALEAPRRRVRENAASESARRLEQAIASGDEHALESLCAEGFTTLHHPTGASSDRNFPLAFWKSLLRSQGALLRNEMLATLGERLALYRQRRAVDAVNEAGIDVSSAESEELVVLEVDAAGKGTYAEIFAAHRLADAVVRLYKRYAESLPEGPERERAAGVARTKSTMKAGSSAEWSAVLAPGFTQLDRRRIGTWGATSPTELLGNLQSMDSIMEGGVLSTVDVLAARPDALLHQISLRGVVRGGGEFENLLLVLELFALDGRLRHSEFFDADREAEALARFDELTAAPAPRAQRRVRANAASAHGQRLAAAVVARDLAAIEDALAPSFVGVHYPTSRELSRAEALALLVQLGQTPGLSFATEPLATLGDTLVLARESTRAAFSGDSRLLGFGEMSRERFTVNEVDARGRAVAAEYFESHQLMPATKRLYERYASTTIACGRSLRAFPRTHSIAIWASTRRRCTLMSYRSTTARWAPGRSAVGRPSFARIKR
jgi:tetratricopeptide (TPR) repeat protein